MSYTDHPVLSGHEALLKLLHQRTEYVNRWLAHVHADCDIHSIVQLPVPGKPLHSLYVLVDKTVVATKQVDRDYLAGCPTLMVQQSVAVADPNHYYPTIRGVKATRN